MKTNLIHLILVGLMTLASVSSDAFGAVLPDGVYDFEARDNDGPEDRFYRGLNLDGLPPPCEYNECDGDLV